MGKRKHKEDSVESIRRKLRRLEKKLDRSKGYEDHEHGSRGPSSDTTPDRRSEDRYTPDTEDYAEYDDYPAPNLPSAVSVVTPSGANPSSAPALVPDPVQDFAPPSLENASEGPVTQPSVAVPDEILQILGQAKTVDESLGENIPSEISERWGKILLDGLAKEQKECIMEKMLIPANFLLARAPKLNPEVNAVLSDAARNRDKRLESAQGQLGSGIAGLVNLTKDLIQSNLDKMEIIKRLSEISQILLDLHYEETINRRKLITPLLDKSFWNTIQGVKRETFLFGDKLGENIKTSKEIERSSQQIKKPAPKRPNFQPKPPLSGNGRLPPRHTNTSNSAAAASGNERQPAAAARRSAAATRSRQSRQPQNRSRAHRRR